MKTLTSYYATAVIIWIAIKLYCVRACPGSFVENGGFCYSFDTSNNYRYHECETRCNNLGAYMICIQNAAQNSYVVSQSTSTWLGYTDSANEGTFVWYSGCSSTYSNFKSGEPNNFLNLEDGVIMTSSGEWADVALNSIFVEVDCGCQINAPTPNPTFAPTHYPSSVPTLEPTSPTSVPSSGPSTIPSGQPTGGPTTVPSSFPSALPSSSPSSLPSTQPSSLPSSGPTSVPSVAPSVEPTSQPSSTPTSPTSTPSVQPSSQPMGSPSSVPSSCPSSIPTQQPVGVPSGIPSAHPTVNPTNSPSIMPTSQPSCAPTVRPSSTPSSMPSIMPSTQPSNLPTSQPTVSPTITPTSYPSAQPSSSPTNPTGSPSSQPSVRPSMQPSSIPSSGPSSCPTVQPTGVPTDTPSCQPSCQPSVNPSTQPTNQPSTVPSMVPTGQPSNVPSVVPSMQPSAVPTGQPSVSPTCQPTTQPSCSPSTSPTSDPSAQPSSAPSRQPSCQPSASPSSQPSTSPTARPTSQPSCNPSNQPTGQPSRCPSSVPSSIPSSQPSGVPSSQPSSSPSAQPSAGPSMQPSSIPSSGPSSCPTVQPTGVPTDTPSCQPSCRPSNQPTESTFLNPTVPSDSIFPTNIPSLLPSISFVVGITNLISAPVSNDPRSSIAVTVLLNNTGSAIVYCGAFQDTAPSSVLDVLKQGFESFAVDSVAVMKISGLFPATKYDVYCFTESIDGVQMSDEEMLSKSVSVSTACCNEVAIDVSTESLLIGTSITAAIIVAVDANPFSVFNIALTLRKENDTSVGEECDVSNQLHPSIVSFGNGTVVDKFSITVVARCTGRYEVLADIVDGSSSDFEIVYSSRSSIEILSIDEEPTTPVVESAMFTNDGIGVHISFSSNTDRGGYKNDFPCELLLSFVGITRATCSWRDDRSILIYPGSDISNDEVLVVGSEVVLLNKTNIRAACSEATDVCSSWSTVSGMKVIVAQPATPISPQASLVLPSRIGICTDLAFDMSSSEGSGGRAWVQPSFSVQAEDVVTTSILNWLIANVTFSPVASIPYELFRAGRSYSFSAAICNFLGVCDTVSRSVFFSNDGMLPFVHIVGEQFRSVVVSDAFVLTSSAYVVDCNGTKSSKGLIYEWTVYEDDLAVPELVSISRNPSVFRLSSYSLTSASSYVVVLTVHNPGTSQSNSARVTIFVGEGSVVAVIRGSQYRLVKIGSSISIDASSSYDEDVNDAFGAAAGLSYSWSCVQLQPIFNESCNLLRSMSNTHEHLEVEAGLSSLGTVSQVTVTVFDSRRSSSADVLVTVIESSAPLISILTSSQELQAVNRERRLILEAVVEVQTACTASWSVDDSEISLDELSLSPTSVEVPLLSSRTVNLVLESYSLPKRSTTSFALTCGSSSATIEVTVNTPPLPGLFAVSPSEGIEISTTFTFTAELWTDEQLPLGYQFGFATRNNVLKLLIQGRTVSSYGSSALPAGSEKEEYKIACFVRVFDVLGAVEERSKTVKVIPYSDVEKEDGVVAQLLLNEGDVSALMRSLSVGSVILSTVDCSLAPNCTSLNRAACHQVENTCGECLDGFVGVESSANELCVDLLDLNMEMSASNNSESIVNCNSDFDCDTWNLCDMSKGLCYLTEKNCANNCSGQGLCEKININTGDEVESCFSNDPACEAVCKCREGYSNSNCELSATELIKKQDTRFQFLSALADVVVTDDADEESIASWARTLSSLAQNPYELSIDALHVVHEIADRILIEASSRNGLVSYSDLTDVLDVIDAGTQVIIESSVSGSEKISLAEKNAELIDRFNDLVTNQVTTGQTEVSFVERNFRMSLFVQLLEDIEGETFTVTAPQTALEEASGLISTSVSISLSNSTTGEYAVSLLSTKSTVYGELGSEMQSNPVHVSISSADGATDAELVLVLPNNVEVNYSTFSYSTECYGADDFKEVQYVCPGSGVIVNHTCDGMEGTLRSICPTRIPACSILDTTSGRIVNSTSICRVANITSVSTTCICTLGQNASVQVSNEGGRRLMKRELQFDGEETTERVALDMVTTAEYAGSEFTETILVADDLNSADDIERVLIVLLMFVVLWSGGFLLIFGCVWRSILLKSRNEADDNKLSRKKMSAEVSRSVGAVKDYLTNYVHEVFPRVFSNQPTLTRMIGEIKRHHRYLTLLTAPHGKAGDKARILTGAQLLSVQTMLMFLLAWLYDLQSPSDDGSCEDHRSKADCLSRRQVLDSSQRYCRWVPDDDSADGYSCEYAEAEFNIKVLIYIAVIVAILVAILSKPIDMIHDLLSAPTADEYKVSNKESFVGRVGRRVSNAMRRLSTSVAKAAERRRSWFGKKNSVVGVATRKLPIATEQAYMLATASMNNIVDRTRQQLQEQQLVRLRMMHSTGDIHVAENNSESDSDDSSSDGGSSERDSGESSGVEHVRDTSEVECVNTSNRNKMDNLSISSLINQVYSQRRLLQPAEVEEYDHQWGMDPSGELASGDKGGFYRWFGQSMGVRELIEKELKESTLESSKKAVKLQTATDAHIGLEMLHLFIMDLLGRYTPAARIFDTKSDEDFQHTRVVTVQTKYLAVVCLIALNAFFVYFSILTGFRRGVEWQRNYLAACLVQFVTEIILFETMECLWVNFVVPVLVGGEVRAVGDAIIRVVEGLCEGQERDPRYFLNAPDFLFVSTKLSKKFPHLMESVLIQSYVSHLPGELAKVWRVGSVARIQRYNRVRRITLLSMILLILQHMATAPFIVHRMFVRFTQPFLFGALVLLWVLITSSAIYMGTAGGLVFLGILGLLAYLIIRWRSDLKKKDNDHRPVTPIDYDSSIAAIMPQVNEFDDTIHMEVLKSNDDLHLPPLFADSGGTNEHHVESLELSCDDESNKSSTAADPVMLCSNPMQQVEETDVSIVVSSEDSFNSCIISDCSSSSEEDSFAT